ncbi:MAG: FKBP-type peptidyl-prolyl cis-trans isomerase [Bacteroidota bacterium]
MISKHFKFQFSVVLFIAFLAVMSACNKNGYEKTESGLEYKIIESKKGRKPKLTDILRMNIKFISQSDSTFANGEKYITELFQPAFKGGLEEGFALMTEGDSASFLIPSDSVFKYIFKQAMPTFIKSGEKVRIEVRLLEVKTKDEFEKLATQEMNGYIQQDKLEIENYLNQNSLPGTAVQPGFYFLILKEGEGNFPSAGDTVRIRFTAKQITGQIFESTAQIGKDFQYVLGAPEVPTIWNIATANLRIGGVYRIIVDTKNRKGLPGTNKLKGPGSVIYDVELIAINEKASV